MVGALTSDLVLGEVDSAITAAAQLFLEVILVLDVALLRLDKPGFVIRELDL